MNSTKWYTLTDFVKWLGRTGQCTVDETEKGWYVTYIDRDPETLARQEKAAKREKQEKDDEERHLEFIRQQAERGMKNAEPGQVEYTELKRESEDEPLKLNLQLIKKPKPEINTFKASVSLEKRSTSDDDSEKVFKKPKPSTSKSESSGRLSAIDDAIRQEEMRKENQNRKDYWLFEDIIVKLIAKSLGDKFYKQKARVVEVVNKYEAKIKMLETGEKLIVDQAHLETVIPNLGKLVRVVNGAYRGELATLKELDEKNFCVTIEVAQGPLKGRVVKRVQYEDICKIYSS